VGSSRFEDVPGEDPAKRREIEEILAVPKQITWKQCGWGPVLCPSLRLEPMAAPQNAGMRPAR